MNCKSGVESRLPELELAVRDVIKGLNSVRTFHPFKPMKDVRKMLSQLINHSPGNMSEYEREQYIIIVLRDTLNVLHHIKGRSQNSACITTVYEKTLEVYTRFSNDPDSEKIPQTKGNEP